MWYVMQASNKAGYTISKARRDWHKFTPDMQDILFSKMPNFESAAGFASHLAKQSPYFHYFVFKV